MTQARQSLATPAHTDGWLISLIEMMPQMIWRASPAGFSTWNSPQLLRYTGQTAQEAIGSGWLSVIHPDDMEAMRQGWRDGRLCGRFDVELRVRGRDGQYKWFQTRAQPVRDADGSITEWIGTSTDIDDLRQLQSRQIVLVAELQHRTRNLIAVIHSICLQTLQHAASLSQFQDAFENRLAALSRVQGLLSKSQTSSVTIGQLVEIELDAVGDWRFDGRVSVSGPDIIVLPSTVQTLALAVHELATNALKHGALSKSDGNLGISWCEHDDCHTRWVRLTWRETNIHIVTPSPDRGLGYGRVLLEEALPKQLGARTHLEFRPHALHCVIEMPIEARGDHGGR